ncbi:MAG: membrane protein [Phycisphaerae bacterium]|nr:hypothetical protein [Phycisphaerales bacterium]MCK6478336.1 OmpA family protein [Phycisphaerales bacterium]
MAGFTNALRGRRLGTFIGLAITLAATALGGCNNVSKEKYDALAQENEELRQQVTQNQSQERQKEEALANALQENNQLKQELAARTAAPQDTGAGGYPQGDSRPQRSMETRNLGTVNFASGSVTLDKASMSTLNSIASALNGRYAGYDVRVEGHADGAPPKRGKYKSNEELSEARADSVKRYLVQRGVSSSRITTAGMGSTTSKVSRDGRRADVIVIGAN